MALNEIILRQAVLADLPEMKELFRGTIMQVCANEYDAAQRALWASSSEKTERWNDLINTQYVLLAVSDDVIVGFGSLLNGNYLDFMYVHKDYQRQGIAEIVLSALEGEAIRRKTKEITSDISKTARPFFEKKGYVVIKEQENQRGDLVLINYKMEKKLEVYKTEVELTDDYSLVASLNEAIQSLHHELYPEIFKSYHKENVAAFFKDVMKDKNTKVLISHNNGEVTGYMLLFVKDVNENAFQYARRFLLIDQLLVLEKARGKGVGKLLLDKAFEIAEQLSITRIQLNHWTLNENAKSFFSRRGFQNHNENMF